MQINKGLLIEKHNINDGAEIITKGYSLSELGTLGTQLSTVIDNVHFEIKDLSSLCGSVLLEKYTVDFSKISNNQQQAILDINNQLEIDGAALLANLIYNEFIRVKPLISDLIQYLTLIQYPKLKRSTLSEIPDTPEISDIAQADILGASIIEKANTDSSVLLIENKITDSENEQLSEENIKNMEEILSW